MYILEIFYSFLFLLAFRYLKILQVKNLPSWLLPSAFFLKMLIGIVFLMMYLHPNEHNSVPSDTMRFLSESKQLQDVYYKTPSDYFNLLAGTGNDEILIQKHLKSTFLWDAGNSSLFNDSRTIIRLHSVIRFISFGSPFIHTLFMCFFAMLGLRQLFISISTFSKLNPTHLFLILLLFPSMLFWTSGILKEPILFLGIGLFSRFILIKDEIKKRILFGAIGAFTLMVVKPYVLICLIPSVVFYLLYKFIFNHSALKTSISILIFVVLSIFIFQNPRDKVVNHLSKKQFEFDHIGKGGLYVRSDTCAYTFTEEQARHLKINDKKGTARLISPTKCSIQSKTNMTPRFINVKPTNVDWMIQYHVKGAQSYIKTTPINYSFAQLIKNIPEAIINSYFRPFVNDPGSSLRFLAMFEVWILTLFLIYSFIKRRDIDLETRGLLIGLIIFSICLLLLIGWTTTVVGAIFRYRFPAQLALILIGVIIIKSDFKKVE